MKINLFFISIVITILFGLGACSETKPTTTNTTESTSTIDLKGTNWVLKKYFLADQEQKLAFQPLLNFDKSGTNYGLQLDVNSCGGAVKIGKNTLNFLEDGFCTEMCCDSEQSKEMLYHLNEKVDYSWDETTKMLVFDAKTPNARLYWAPKVELNEQLTDTKWKLQHFIGRGKPELFEKDYFITLSNGRATLELDVNVCNAPYTVLDEKTIQINSPFGCSRKCCDSQQGQDIAKLLARKIMLNLDKDKLYLGIPVSDRSIACIKAPARD